MSIFDRTRIKSRCHSSRGNRIVSSRRLSFLACFVLVVMSALSELACAMQHPSTTLPAPAAESPPAAGTLEKDGMRIPIVLNSHVEKYVSQFAMEKKTFQRGLNNSVPHLDRMKEIFRSENLPEELVYVVMIESVFNPVAVSSARAVGLWQFMPETARAFGLRIDQWVDERKDHLKSTRAAARYFKALYSQLRCWALAMAAYNAGIGTVRQAILKSGTRDFWHLNQSDHLRRETKNYVPKVMAATIIARDPEAYGFRMPESDPLRFDVVRIRKSMNLRAIARDINTPLAMIKSLNPEIRGFFTPPDGYLLKIPEGKRKIFIATTGEGTRKPVDLSQLSTPSLPLDVFRSGV